MPEHKQNTQVNQISISSTSNGQNSTKFDPSLFIVPVTQPKPIVSVPENLEVCILDNIGKECKRKWGDIVEEGEWAMSDEEWEEFRQELANPFDGSSLYHLFEETDQPDPQKKLEWGLSKFIVSDSYAKPIVNMPSESQVCQTDQVVCITGMVNTLGYVNPDEQKDWQERWEEICADPLDGISLLLLFEEAET